MKYIRTKDKVFELHILDNGSKFIKKGNLVAPLFEADEKYITKEADTINKLCDSWVAVYEDSHCFEIGYFYIDGEKRKIPSLKQINPINKKPIKVEIYGAIWTDKGLIYVAKMNEKGELELL